MLSQVNLLLGQAFPGVLLRLGSACLVREPRLPQKPARRCFWGRQEEPAARADTHASNFGVTKEVKGDKHHRGCTSDFRGWIKGVKKMACLKKFGKIIFKVFF